MPEGSQSKQEKSVQTQSTVDRGLCRCYVLEERLIELAFAPPTTSDPAALSLHFCRFNRAQPRVPSLEILIC